MFRIAVGWNGLVADRDFVFVKRVWSGPQAGRKD
jgi:hypothetical protein